MRVVVAEVIGQSEQHSSTLVVQDSFFEIFNGFLGVRLGRDGGSVEVSGENPCAVYAHFGGLDITLFCSGDVAGFFECATFVDEGFRFGGCFLGFRGMKGECSQEEHEGCK